MNLHQLFLFGVKEQTFNVTSHTGSQNRSISLFHK